MLWENKNAGCEAQRGMDSRFDARTVCQSSGCVLKRERRRVAGLCSDWVHS